MTTTASVEKLIGLVQRIRECSVESPTHGSSSTAVQFFRDFYQLHVDSPPLDDAHKSLIAASLTDDVLARLGSYIAGKFTSQFYVPWDGDLDGDADAVCQVRSAIQFLLDECRSIPTDDGRNDGETLDRRLNDFASRACVDELDDCLRQWVTWPSVYCPDRPPAVPKHHFWWYDL